MRCVGEGCPSLCLCLSMCPGGARILCGCVGVWRGGACRYHGECQGRGNQDHCNRHQPRQVASRCVHNSGAEWVCLRQRGRVGVSTVEGRVGVSTAEGWNGCVHYRGAVGVSTIEGEVGVSIAEGRSRCIRRVREERCGCPSTSMPLPSPLPHTS